MKLRRLLAAFGAVFSAGAIAHPHSFIDMNTTFVAKRPAAGRPENGVGDG